MTQERLNEIAMKALLEKFRKEGVMLRPIEVKRDVHNFAKKLGIPVYEAAECFKLVYEKIFEETMSEVHSLIG